MISAKTALLARTVKAFPVVAAVLLVGVIYATHLYLTFRYEHLNPVSNSEEWAYTNIAANNFLRFGYLNSLFLQDHSTSSAPEDHPYVYNHMPAGAENATAVLLALTEHDYRWTRFFFALFVIPGLYYFVRFAQLLFDRISLRGASLVLFSASPWVIISQMEAQIHSVLLLLGFAPLVWLIEHGRQGGRWRLILAVLFLFILSIYVQYMLVAAIVFGLLFLWALKVAKLRFMHVALGAGAISAGVFAHLLQNFMYFGPDLFFKELIYTLGNRAVGIPGKEELREFYESIAVVHHGSRPVEPTGFLKIIIRNLLVPQWQFLLLLLIGSGVVAWFERKRSSLTNSIQVPESFNQRFWYVIRLYVWAGLTVVSVILLFPAFTQEINLGVYGINYLILGIPSIALIMMVIELGHGVELCGLCLNSSANEDSGAWHWAYLYLIALLGVLHFAPFFLGGGIKVQILLIAIFLVCLAWSWATRAPDRAVIDEPSGQAQAPRGLYRLCLFVIGVFSLCALVKGTLVEGISIAKVVKAGNYLDPMKDLKSLHGKLFMTNINLPAVGFFVDGPGFGVCGLDTVSDAGKIDSKQCKISFLKKTSQWRTQEPEVFIFFWDQRVFPGFSECIPYKNLLQESPETQPSCIIELRQRLLTNFPLLQSNSLFEVYDLRPSQSVIR